jgi:para-aminobenzoate synthetase/4-amino-4-deoxychorismate lyase
MENQVFIQDKQGRRWLRFAEPVEIFSVQSVDDVVPTLEKIDEAVNGRDLHAAGFIGYEASPAFDPAFSVREPSSLPLLWFGLYRQPEIVALPSGLPAYQLGKWLPSVSGSEYEEAIASIKELIASGRTYQVNYTFRLRSRFTGEPWGLFLDLVKAQEAQFAAFVDTGSHAICSASPELFFELNGSELLSRPMKGTAERGRTLAEDQVHSEWLRKSEKNRAENVMIVDMVRNDMGRVCELGSVHVPSLFDVERYPTIWQMTSTVRSRSMASIPEILTALFPCASITGAPKVSTMNIISDLESTPRGVYTGCIGFIAPGRYAQFNVAIRTVVVDKATDEAEYGVGGGIVWDSSTGDEFRECQAKARVLTERRPKFELLESILWTPGDEFFLLEEHLQRLADSGEYFGFAFKIDEIRQELVKTIPTFPSIALKVRLTVSRTGELVIEHEPVEFASAVTLALAENPVRRTDVFLYHKTTNRQVYEKALKGRTDCDDVLLWNEKGEITESTMANVIAELAGEMFTPPTECGLLPGTFRESLLAEGVLTERVIALEDLDAYDSLYLINSVRKWRKANLIKGHD